MARAVIRLDRVRCRGTGLCAAMSERHFEVDASGTGRVRMAEVSSEADYLEALSIAECCPTEAITVTPSGPDSEGRPAGQQPAG
ncbi:ferredoxin [Streptomyces sp. NPDC002952]|uniref:ferredoxin n=1 Tax=Streptomyces sp. NPDC002952 TaxID=3364673 RepID=UPI0036B11D18